MRSKPSQAQANAMLLEHGVLVACAVVAVLSGLHSLWKVKRSAEQVKDVAREAVGQL